MYSVGIYWTTITIPRNQRNMLLNCSHSETNTSGTSGEENKESDYKTPYYISLQVNNQVCANGEENIESDSKTPYYTSLQVNNQVCANTIVDDGDAIYENL